MSTNFALATNGSTISTNTGDLSGSLPLSTLIDGQNYDSGVITNSRWFSAQSFASVGSPVWVEIDFGTTRSITTLVLYNIVTGSTSEPSDVDTATITVTGKVQTWNGSSWDDRGTFTSENLAKAVRTWSAVSTTKARIYVTDFLYGGGTFYPGFQEIQFWDSLPDSTPPSNVGGTPTATPVSSSQINCDWADATDNVAVTDYKLDRATDSGFTTNLVSGDIGSSTSAKNVTGLSANTTYYFRVKAKDGAGNYSASWSSTFSATTWNVAPTMTNGTTLTTAHQGISYDETITTTGGNGTLTVTLKSGSSYPGGLSLSANHLVGTPTTVGSYSFTFVVTDSNGQNSEKTFNLTVDDITAPADMTLGTVTVISSSQLNVAFTTPTDNVSVTSLKIQRCQLNTFSGGTLAEFTGVSTSSPYTSSGLSENTTYYYRAKAFDGTNYSTNWSNTVSGTTTYTPPVSGFTLSTATLEAGDTLSVTDTSTGTSRTYQWKINSSPTVVSTSATPNLTPYLDNGTITIKQIVTNDGGSSEITHDVEVIPKIVSVGNVLTKTIASLSLASGITFKYRVRAKDENGTYSPYSNQV